MLADIFSLFKLQFCIIVRYNAAAMILQLERHRSTLKAAPNKNQHKTTVKEEIRKNSHKIEIFLTNLRT